MRSEYIFLTFIWKYQFFSSLKTEETNVNFNQYLFTSFFISIPLLRAHLTQSVIGSILSYGKIYVYKFYMNKNILQCIESMKYIEWICSPFISFRFQNFMYSDILWNSEVSCLHNCEHWYLYEPKYDIWIWNACLQMWIYFTLI